MAESTLERVKKVLVEYRDFDPKTITEKSAFAELGLDSLDTVDLVMKLQDEFKKDIPMDEGLKTVGDLVKLLDK